MKSGQDITKKYEEIFHNDLHQYLTSIDMTKADSPMHLTLKNNGRR